MAPVWAGTYTDSDRVANRLQERILMSNYTQPNSVTPIISDALIIAQGDTAEANITGGLYSLGYSVPLTLSSSTTQKILAAVAEKEIIYQLLISTELKAECSCSGFDIAELDKLIEDYGSTLERFLDGVGDCSIALEGELKGERPCESPIMRAATMPTTVAVVSPRSSDWKPAHTIRF